MPRPSRTEAPPRPERVRAASLTGRRPDRGGARITSHPAAPDRPRSPRRLRRAAPHLALAAAWLAAGACGDARRVTLGPVDGQDLPPADTGRVKVGDVAPDFSLQSYDRGVVTLSDFRGQKDVILVFYRGFW